MKVIKHRMYFPQRSLKSHVEILAAWLSKIFSADPAWS